MTSRDNTLREVVQFVRSQSQEVSVKDIAEAVGISNGYARELAVEAVDRGRIDGSKSVPIIGYIFDKPGRTRTDGGGYGGDLRVLPTRDGLLSAVEDYPSHRYEEARGMSLEDLRSFVRNHVADTTVPVGHAWRFEG